MTKPFLFYFLFNNEHQANHKYNLYRAALIQELIDIRMNDAVEPMKA